jgi:hypothetical protein
MTKPVEEKLANRTIPTIQSWWSDWTSGRRPDQDLEGSEFPDNVVWGKPAKHDSMQHIPLAHAYLCQDCNCIGNCASQCPACASEVLLNLAGVLDRGSEMAVNSQVAVNETYMEMTAFAA